MLNIIFPPYQPSIKKLGLTDHVFDDIRKKWIVLTPEEWVRQNFIQYLTISKKYPASLLAIEKEIRLGDLKKRCDIVVFDNSMKPCIIVECKGMNIPITQKTLDQALRYNITLNVPIIIITNGRQSFAYSLQNGEISSLAEIPGYI
jgi:type I site-specific restriction endonuclease